LDFPAETRVSILKDSGWSVGCNNKDPYFCIYFAKGCCTQGSECHFLHRLPTKSDQERIPLTKDCFGRSRHSQDREDMSGVGSFNRDCRTLYVINMKNIPELNMEEVVIRHFKEFGKLEYVKVFQERCYAFLKYELRACAEFAKIAMQGQNLDADECIKVKWSTDDPNPMNMEREILEKRKKLKTTIEEKGVSTKNLPFNYPKDYTPQDTTLPSFINTQGDINDSKKKGRRKY